ncbi:phospholipid carrier-dependent glycosyltransferase [Paenibacillus sp. GCM10027627]|uniref:phospholipid carrier-dependent glycosyltransferase n=1 Tax=unclassified Paenibacillus TaxID=185978 RepID=UPI00363DDA74
MSKGFLRTAMLLFVLFLAVPGLAANAADNMLVNGDFEGANNSMPDGWNTEAWVQDRDATDYGIDQEVAYSGKQSAYIHNLRDNHARFVQPIKVKADSTYRISGYIKTEGLNTAASGAHFFVDGVAVHYPQIHDTAGVWSYLEFYGKTGKKQTELTVGASLGGYGSVTSGKAWFDSLTVENVSSAPDGAEVFSLVETTVESQVEGEPEKVSIASTLLYAVLFTMLFAIIYTKCFKEQFGLVSRKSSLPLLLAGSFAAALALRLYIALSHGGYANDIALFMSWSDHAVNVGLSNFYHTDIFVDYPPGYIYILFVLGHLKNMLGLDGDAAMLLYKLPAIAADLGAAALLYRTALKKFAPSVAFGLAAVWLFNPAVILDSSAWGQVDSVFALPLVLAIIGITERRFGRASVWYAIAALIKPQAFIFMPVLLVALWANRKWKDVAVSAYYGFATFILLALPFFWTHGGLKGLYELYSGTLSSYPYATLNAFNLYTLTGGNWKPLTEGFLFLSYSQWGNVFILAAVVLAIWYSFAGKRGGKEGDRSFFAAMILISVVFLFVTKMHERYMFPVILLSLFAFIQSADRRLLHLFYGFSITNFINMSYVLAYSKTTTNVPADGVSLLVAITNLALFLYMLYIGYDRYAKGRTVALAVIGQEDKRLLDEETLEPFRTGTGETERRSRFRLGRADWIWMGSITAVYAIVALLGLGSLKGPVTVWQPDSTGDSFYVDLGQAKSLERITSFGGVGTGKYKYEFGLSPGEWTNPIEVDNSHVAVFSWKSQKIAQEARYVKLTVTEPGFSMHELAFYETGSKTPLPIAAVVDEENAEPRRGKLSQLFDEQQLMIYNHNYMKGSYFDEIYHARTAYEHIEGIVAYENTHPPLGKIILAIGIKLFGLNPFGWRIAGTLIGIAMIPVMYLMAKRIFGRTAYAALAAGLLAVDFMHFTQTRIATIDVYGVFFIMLMFYFMNKYFAMNFYKDKLMATLVPLGLAGLFFGLGVASKWIVLYGGAGLAVMLFLSLWDRMKQYLAAKRLLKQDGGLGGGFDEAALKRIVSVFPKYTVITLLSCLLFYLAVPAGIYALSYIPVLSVMEGGYTLKALIDYQVNMYNYHSNLVSSHPFSSSWWEWPFMKRPVWYYSGSELAAGMKSTIVAMGNPLIWWVGIFMVLLTVWGSIKRKDKSVYMVWIAFFAQYVPWMLVPRETFLYHYFAMVPFLILCIVYIFKRMEERKPAFSKIRNGFMAAAAALFVLFYPALSGMTVPAWYVDIWLRWFPSWVF